MRKILISALFCLPLLISSPSLSQVSVQVNIGNPAVRPWPDGVWVPGYYYVQPDHRRVWRTGKWRHDNGRHLGQYKDHGNSEKGRGKDHGNGKGRGEN